MSEVLPSERVVHVRESESVHVTRCGMSTYHMPEPNLWVPPSMVEGKDAISSLQKNICKECCSKQEQGPS